MEAVDNHNLANYVPTFQYIPPFQEQFYLPIHVMGPAPPLLVPTQSNFTSNVEEQEIQKNKSKYRKRSKLINIDDGIEFYNQHKNKNQTMRHFDMSHCALDKIIDGTYGVRKRKTTE